MKLLDSFLKISLHTSKQEPSVITLQNMVERIEDMKEELQKKQTDFELIDCFPIVGWGLNIDKKKVNNKRKFTVTKISSVEKIVDESVLCYTNKKTLKDQPNCILPLFYEDEDNKALLKCELFRRKMSYMLLGNVDKYEDDSHLIIMQSTLKFLLQGQLNYSWQNDLIRQIYETCKLIFVGEPNFYNDIDSELFKKSEFKLLNIFCLSLSQQIEPETIFLKYIMPKIKRYPCLNAEINDNFKNFFEKLEFAKPETIYSNLEKYIQNYLISKHYFYFELVQERRIQNLIQILIPQQIHNQIYKEIPFFKYEEIDEPNGLTEEEFETKYKIIGYTKASVNQYLLKNLLTTNQNIDNKNIEILCDIVDSDDNYKTFLQNHSQFDFLLQFAQLLSEKDEQLFIKLVISQIQINKVFKFKENKIKCSKDILVKLQNNCQEFNQGYQIITNMISIFKFTENQNDLINKIFIIISEIIWLNNWVNESNFNKKEDIHKLLKIFQEYSQDQYCERYQQVYLYNLNDISKYCYRLKMKTCNFQQFILADLDDDEIELPKKDVISRICLNILRISKEYFQG